MKLTWAGRRTIAGMSHVGVLVLVVAIGRVREIEQWEEYYFIPEILKLARNTA